jgi:hypothetical protein
MIVLWNDFIRKLIASPPTAHIETYDSFVEFGKGAWSFIG